MGRHARKSEINRRRARRQKLLGLRQRYAAAKTESERAKVLERVRRLRPAPTQQDFLAPLQRSAEIA